MLSESVNILALPLSSNFFAAFLPKIRITAPASDFGLQISSLQITILRSVQQKTAHAKVSPKSEKSEASPNFLGTWSITLYLQVSTIVQGQLVKLLMSKNEVAIRSNPES